MSVYFLARYLGIQFCTIVCGTHNQHYWALICMLSSVFMISDGKIKSRYPSDPKCNGNSNNPIVISVSQAAPQSGERPVLTRIRFNSNLGSLGNIFGVALV